MVQASHYVIKNLSRVLLKRDLEAAEELFNKFAVRYTEDEELQKVCDEFDAYLKTRDIELMNKITKDIEELMYLRKLESLVKEMRIRGGSKVVKLT